MRGVPIEKPVKTERLGLYLGFLIAAIFAVLGYYYFEYRDRMDSNARSQGLFGFMEASDQRFNDFKYQFRGVKSVDSPVALVAIDDDSLRQMGRWPWRREMMADLTQQLLDGGVKSIAFDMIFSEADDKDPVSDRKLAQLFENHSQIGSNAHNFPTD